MNTLYIYKKENQWNVDVIGWEFDVYIQGVQEKLCFFKILCNHSLAFIAVKDLQSSHRNASVQSLQLAGNFLYNQ